jgi:hypothetical protein
MDWTCKDNQIILFIFVLENICYLDKPLTQFWYSAFFNLPAKL